MNILFVVPYPHGKAPSQRFRYEQYLAFLKDKNWHYTLAPFLDDNTWSILYKPGFISQKVLGIIWGFMKRIILLFSVYKFDYVFIHREATPIGPPWFEWLVSKVFRKKIIYDFDDAIWIPNTSATNKIVAGIKWHGKVASICKWAYKVSTGNAYLQEYARQFNSNVIVNPTTIDTRHHHNRLKNQATDKITVGWTGTHSTMKYLAALVPVLQDLEQKYPFELKVISNQAPELPLQSLVYQPWRKDQEIEDLLTFNVGLMPLEDDPWAKGKCAFKALQYMALGIPALVSPVGMNTEVVTDGQNGFICATPRDWYTKLERLIQDVGLRTELGAKARQKVETSYAVVANRATFLGLFK